MSEYKEAYTHWSRLARNEFTRAQIVETAKDNIDMCSPIWNAMQDELAYLDKLSLAKEFRREARRLKRFDRRWRKDKSRKVQ